MKKQTLLVTVFIFCLFSTSFANQYKPSDDLKLLQEKSFKISPGKDLILKTSSGDVEITPWDKEEVAVKVWGNEAAAEKVRFIFEGNDSEIRITAKSESGWNLFRNIRLRFEVKVPSSFNVQTSTAGGDIKLGGVNGKIDLNTSGGDIWGDRFKGDFIANTSGGDIKLITSDSRVEANTSGGDIELNYTGVNKGIELNTSGGDILIKLPSDFNAELKISTSGGDVSCDAKLNNVKKMSDTKIYADINNGGPLLDAHTSGGDIDVKIN